jgi:glucosylglycerol-phosphate synthase
MDRMDEAIDLALNMSEEEKRERMAKMYATVTKYDVEYWANRLLQLFKQSQNIGESARSTVSK